MTGLPTSVRISKPPAKPSGTAPAGFGETSRLDSWWAAPLSVGFWLAFLVVYSFFSALLWQQLFGTDYEVDGYTSPFFAPFFRDAPLPSWLSPAILTLWIPIGFRITCYYFRRAYYRAYLVDPPACAVGEPTIHRRYRMEAALPFILQNLHRFFLYLAVVLLVIHWFEVVQTFSVDGRLRLGLGSLILLTDVLLLTGYVSSCHSLRHFVGGRLDCFSCTRRDRTRYAVWRRLSGLNERHMVWAWASLISVVIADFYIRMLAAGVVADPAVWF
jgi:hypothetical protein